jgi:CysZ protein
MLDAAAKALAQMLSPPFRLILMKSMGLALLLLVAAGVGLQRLFTWFATSGEVWIETTFGPSWHAPLAALWWIFAIAAGLGVITAAVLLMSSVTALMAGFFADEIAQNVEQEYYPEDPPGSAVPIGVAIIEAVKAAVLSILVYLCTVPFLLLFGLGFIVLFLANAYLLGRLYFELAALRFHPVDEAKRLRRRYRGEVFLSGCLIAAFVSVPIVNLATPLFGTALMVHVHKRLSGPPPKRIEREAIAPELIARLGR